MSAPARQRSRRVGATASLIDTATAMALIGTFGIEEKATTIDLNVHFLRPVMEGEIMHGEDRERRQTNPLSFSRGLR